MIPTEKARAARKTGSLPPQYGRGPAGAGAGTVIVEEEVLATERPVALPQLPGRLQPVQVLRAKSRGPGPYFVLRDPEPGVRIVVADTVQRRLRFVIGDPQQHGATRARHQRPGSNQQFLLLQALAIGAVSVNVLQNFFQRLAIAKNGERVHWSSGRVVEGQRARCRTVSR